MGGVAESVKTVLGQPRAVAGWIRRDDLLRHGGLLAGASVVSGGMNYAFQIFMGRALPPETYGVLGALFGLFYVMSIVTRGIQFSAIRFTAATGSRNVDKRNVHGWLLFGSLALGLGCSVALVAAGPVVATFLGVASVWPVVLVAATITFDFPFRGNMGSFQGHQWFGLQAGYNALYAGTKLAVGVGMVVLGYGLYGALAALVVASALSLAATTLHFRHRLGGWSVPVRDGTLDYAGVSRYFGPAVLAGFCLVVPANVDVLLVSYFFAGERVGFYVAASVLGKVLIYFSMGISKAMFPKVTDEWTEGENGSSVDRIDSLLNRALAYATVVAGSGVVAFWALPELVLRVFFGHAYVGAAPLLQWYGVAALCFVLCIVVLNFELARDRMRFVYVFAAVSVVEIVLMGIFNGTMIGIIWVILAVNAALFAYGIYEAKR